MTKILKDKNGNIITTLPIYCATDVQVQNSVDKRIKDGTIVIPTPDTPSTGDSILTLKSTSDCTGSKTTVEISDVASATENGKGASGNSVSAMTRYTINNVKKGDVITTASSNNDNNLFYANSTNLTSNATKVIKDNYSWVQYTFVADKDYDIFYVACLTAKFAKGRITWTYTIKGMENYPSYNDEFIPTISDTALNDLKVFSSLGLINHLGYDITGQKAKENLEGGVWIGFGDSYTVYADTYFKKIASKYGLIYDGQGKVSSTICGDSGGNKGFSPFWVRMNTFISNYTGSGQTIDGVTYNAENVKLITFMGGANDGFGKDSWLGSHTSMDTNYIYGACNYMFKKLRENFPNAEIICILQPANYSDAMNYTDEQAKTLGFTSLEEMQSWDIYSFGQYKMETKERAVKKCAERFGIPIVDCIFDWYSVVNPTHRKLYWNTDKIHLSAQGSQELANKLDLEIIKQCGRI